LSRCTLTQAHRIRFTKHAREKFDLVKHYGFEVNEETVLETVRNPTRLDKRNAQYFATGAMDAKYALRVVYERRKDFILVITFYPVRRKRHGI